MQLDESTPPWDVDEDPFNDPTFRNHYECPCGHEWSDKWSAICDDDCPECGVTCSPSDTEDLTD